ncbi:MAG: hypothetical protein ACFB6R_15370 [Alphaproteobacteria bacterium]
MPTDPDPLAKAITAAVDEIRLAADKVRGMRKSKRRDEAVEALERARDRLRAARDQKNAGVEMNGMEDFFHAVGRSVIRAQEHLDRRSMAYSAAKTPQDLGALFRIPKVTAEMRFGLKRTEGQTLDVLFYKEDQEDVSTLFNRVTFDVVAVPPPPDLLAPAPGAFGSPLPLTEPRDRAEAFRLLRAVTKGTPAGSFDSQRKALLGRSDGAGILIVRLPAERMGEADSVMFLFREPVPIGRSGPGPLRCLVVEGEGDAASGKAIAQGDLIGRLEQLVMGFAGRPGHSLDGDA